MRDHTQRENRHTNDEHPSPAGQSGLTIQLGDSISQKTAESTCKTRRAKKESETLLGLATLVPPNRKLRTTTSPTWEVEDIHGNEVETPREDAGLGQTQEEASYEESRVALHETLADGNASENKHAQGD